MGNATRISPPLRRRRLGLILRELRAQEKLTLAEAGRRLGWSTAKAGKIETGATRPSPEDVWAALELYGASEELREQCMLLAGQAAARPWWTPYRSVLGEYVAWETEAALIRSWQPQLVEGLLQTAEYARAVVLAARPDAKPIEVDLRVRARMARQALLTGLDPLSLVVVLQEDALRAPVGGAAVMKAQVAHLQEAAGWPTVTIRVLPRWVGAHPGMAGAFVLLSLPGDPVSLFVEGAPEEIITSKDAVVREHERRFDHLAASSLGPEETLEFLGRIARELDAE